MVKSPSYDGTGLVNLMAELEHRLTGASKWPRLTDTTVIPDAPSYVFVLFDGLGTAHLEHKDAGSFRTSLTGVLEAPFPTTTSVSLATVATGLPPSQHGQVAHLQWMPDLEKVVNTLKWVTPHGEHVGYEYGSLLPGPNLWERLRAAGVEPITVQPGEFAGSPLSRALYRGCRFEGVWDVEDMVKATVQLASEPGRLIFTYVNQVDFAGHVFGLESKEFGEAMRLAVGVWEKLAAQLPPDVALIGTADHGLAEFGDDQKMLIRDHRFDGLRFAGDSRGVQMWGERALMDEMVALTGGELADPRALVGPDPTDLVVGRLGERVLIPPDHLAVLPRGFDKRLRCYHGGLSRAEVEIPLLVG